MVVEDRVGDLAVAVERADEVAPSCGWSLTITSPRPVTTSACRMRSGQRELADVVEQAGGVDEVLLSLVAANLGRQRLRVAGDRGGVLADRPVAQR